MFFVHLELIPYRNCWCMRSPGQEENPILTQIQESWRERTQPQIWFHNNNQELKCISIYNVKNHLHSLTSSASSSPGPDDDGADLYI